MSTLNPSAQPPTDRVEALTAALIEIERHVARHGWDGPTRLFGLAATAELITAEPSLAHQLTETAPGALSSIEQEDFNPDGDLLAALERISWPPQVAGAAICTERSFLKAGEETDLPDDPAEAARVVAEHPAREDIRVVIGVLRDGTQTGVARLARQPEELLVGADLVPALTRALAHTLT